MDKERKQFITYSNLNEFLKYRRINSSYKFLDQKEFAKEIDNSKSITISGETTNNRPGKPQREKVLIIFVGFGSLYAAKLNEFKKIFRIVEKELSNDKDELAAGKLCYNIIFITAEDVTTNIKKFVAEENIKDVHFEFHNYNKFIIINPKHVMVPKHEIILEEAADYMNQFYVDKSMLPKILSIDPAVIWIGGRSGDIIKITRVSENAGISVNYRRVVEVVSI